MNVSENLNLVIVFVEFILSSFRCSILNIFEQPYLISNTHDENLFENIYQPKTVDYIHKKTPSLMFHRFLSTLLVLVSLLLLWQYFCKEEYVDVRESSVTKSFILVICSTRFWIRLCTEAVTWSWSVKKIFLKISQNSQENTCARVSLYNNVAVLRSPNLSKNRLWHKCFSTNFAKFIGTPF